MTGRPGGGYHHEFGYETFVVKPPGRIRVQAQLDPDTHTRPEPVEDINLIVYDNVRDHRPPVIAGCALFIAGVALGVFGIVKLIAAPRPRPVA